MCCLSNHFTCSAVCQGGVPQVVEDWIGKSTLWQSKNKWGLWRASEREDIPEEVAEFLGRLPYERSQDSIRGYCNGHRNGRISSYCSRVMRLTQSERTGRICSANFHQGRVTTFQQLRKPKDTDHGDVCLKLRVTRHDWLFLPILVTHKLLPCLAALSA